ncbi:MAG: helix-turn-helix transcriptional regulator [Bacteroidetes bacterium]|nr:helix-turn-helix transcriptional regulator [Bacteroidota bacterium]
MPGYPMNPQTFGQRIRKTRMDKGLLQKDVAMILGVTECTITNWENGRRQPHSGHGPKIQLFLQEIKM